MVRDGVRLRSAERFGAVHDLAKWLLAQGSFTDEELTILATEASSDDDAKT